MNRDGKDTSEFKVLRWVLLAVAILEPLVRSGILPPESRWSALAAAILAGLYAVSRGIAKLGRPSQDELTIKLSEEKFDSSGGG